MDGDNVALRRGRSLPAKVVRTRHTSRPVIQREGSFSSHGGGGDGGQGTPVASSSSGSGAGACSGSGGVTATLPSGSGPAPERTSTSSSIGFQPSSAGIHRGLVRSGDKSAQPLGNPRRSTGSQVNSSGGIATPKVKSLIGATQARRTKSSGPSMGCGDVGGKSALSDDGNPVKVKLYAGEEDMMRLCFVRRTISFEEFEAVVAERCEISSFNDNGEAAPLRLVMSYIDTDGDCIVVDRTELHRLLDNAKVEFLKIQVTTRSANLVSSTNGAGWNSPSPSSSPSIMNPSNLTPNAAGSAPTHQHVLVAGRTQRTVNKPMPVVVKTRKSGSVPQGNPPAGTPLAVPASQSAHPLTSCPSPAHGTVPRSVKASTGTTVSTTPSTSSHSSVGPPHLHAPVKALSLRQRSEVVDLSRSTGSSSNGLTVDRLGGGVTSGPTPHTPPAHINPFDSTELVPKYAKGGHRRAQSASVGSGTIHPMHHDSNPTTPANSGSSCSTLTALRRTPGTPRCARSLEDLESDDERLHWTSVTMIGKGAYGSVYEARLPDGSAAAVKVIDVPNYRSDRQEVRDLVRKLLREINLMRELHHPNIVSYIHCQLARLDGRPGYPSDVASSLENSSSAGTGNSMSSASDEPIISRSARRGCGGVQVQIFMELCREGNLADYVRVHGTPERGVGVCTARRILRDVLEGLAYLHSCNYIHRDIKADNVLIGNDGMAKLGDFGCSRRIAAATMTVRDESFINSGNRRSSHHGAHEDSVNADYAAESGMAHTMTGTPLFMAPEMIKEGETVGYGMPADIWAVGCLVLFLFNRSPWPVNQGVNFLQVMYKIVHGTGMPPGVPENAPRPLRDFLTRCFDRDPARRGTAKSLLEMEWITCPDSALEELPAARGGGGGGNTVGGGYGPSAGSSVIGNY